MYDLLAWRAWASNAKPEEVAEKLALQQDEIVRMREAVRVLAADVTRQAKRCASAGRESDVVWEECIDARVKNNPIAAAAVKEASDAGE